MASASARPTVIRGFSEEYGSCGTSWTLRRAARSCPRPIRAVSWSSSSTRPDSGASSPTSTLASVDLPDPDSPTMPMVRPGATASETSRSTRADREPEP
jgi:hypothetical protein